MKKDIRVTVTVHGKVTDEWWFKKATNKQFEGMIDDLENNVTLLAFSDDEK